MDTVRETRGAAGGGETGAATAHARDDEGSMRRMDPREHDGDGPTALLAAADGATVVSPQRSDRLVDRRVLGGNAPADIADEPGEFTGSEWR